MARRQRLAINGVPLHVIQRGYNGNPCFFVQKDYEFYLVNLIELSCKYSCSVHAYVLMPNHIHLLLTPHETDSASHLMKYIGQRYVQYINRSHDRSGTLWEGRFRSCLVHGDQYVLDCYRYIETNPVRLNIVRHSRVYPWTSFHANADGKSDKLIIPHEAYMALGHTVTERQMRYCAMAMQPLGTGVLDEINRATNGNYIYGEEQFKNNIAKLLHTTVKPGKPGRPRNIVLNIDADITQPNHSPK